MENRPDKEIDTLYFDGACPLCSKEMARLKNCASASTINLIDIHTISPAERQQSPELPDKESLLRTLHLKTESGLWLTGLDANIYAWRSTPYAKYWRLLSLPGIYWSSKKAYSAWAKIRYRNLIKRTGKL